MSGVCGGSISIALSERVRDSCALVVIVDAVYCWVHNFKALLAYHIFITPAEVTRYNGYNFNLSVCLVLFIRNFSRQSYIYYQ